MSGGVSLTTVLTSGRDEVLASTADQTVQSTSATLTTGLSSGSNDSLDGGAGLDVLSLTGSGTFNLRGLDKFIGFEEVRLANTTASSASLILRDGVDIAVTLSDGTTAPSTFSLPTTVSLGTGLVTLHGGNETDVISADMASRLKAGSVIDGGGGSDSLNLIFDLSNPMGGGYDSATGTYAPPTYADTLYDLTNISLSHIENLYVGAVYNPSGSITSFPTPKGSKIVVNVDTASLADVAKISNGFYDNARVTTASSSLDLTGKTVIGIQVESSNASGTTFTVDSAATALQVIGGAGSDTLVVKGVSLTAAQREQVFAGSIETLTDASGTYAKPALPPGTVALTSGRDVVAPSSADQIVQAISATLNTTGAGSADSLDGGGGYDVLRLFGSGSFNLNDLDTFTGVEEVRLTNASPASSAYLTLRDGVDLRVTLSDGTAAASASYYSSSGISVTLGTGLVTLRGGNESDSISATGAGRLRAGSTIDGGAGYDTLNLLFDYANSSGGGYNSKTGVFTPPIYADTVYDLTKAGLSHVESLYISGPFGTSYNGARTVVSVDNASLADVASIYANGDARFTTTASDLDLTGRSITGARFESSNASGTTFTVNSASAALQIAGGAGNDTVVARGVVLTSAQRDQILSGSVETVTDAFGSYTKSGALPSPAGTVILTTGRDAVLASSLDQTVQATSATLNTNGSGSTDSLVGGDGTDVLSLVGGGSFNLAGLDAFSGFEEVRLINPAGDFTILTNFASLTLRDGLDLKVTLSDGTTAANPYYLPSSFISVTLGTGVVTLNGGNENDFVSATGAGRLRAGSVIDGGAGNDTLSLFFDFSNSVSGSYADTVYDLTKVSLSHVETLSVNGPLSSSNGARTVVKVDAASLADVTTISNLSAGTEARLTTEASTLDLSGRTVTGVKIESSNALGTTFTVDSAAAALQIVGGSGSDTLVVKGLTLTSAQRDQIFTNSVETLTDASGTYAKPAAPLSPAIVTLTTGRDVVTASATDQTVQGTGMTLTTGFSIGSNDSLDGGDGYDVLSLTGPGNFNLAGLDKLAAFEEVRLTNTTGSYASLTLRDGVDIAVSLFDGSATPGAYSNAGSINLTLGAGLVTLKGGNESDSISATGGGRLRAGSIIDGGAGPDSLNLFFDYANPVSGGYDTATGTYTPPTYADTVYDLTKVSLSHVESLYLGSSFASFSYGDAATVVNLDTASLVDVTSIVSSNSGGARLTTAASTLNLSGKSISGVPVESSNASGTTFTVDSAATALQVIGGAGSDTLVVKGVSLTAAQREQVFAGSIETLTDASGTYAKPALTPGTVALTSGRDVIAPSSADQTVQAISATLNTTGAGSADSLDGGGGYDVLRLFGSGSFNLNRLDTFLGFEEVRLINASLTSSAGLYLRDGIDLKVTLSDGTAAPGAFASTSDIYVALGTGSVTLQGGNERDFISVNGAGRLRAGDVIDGGAGYDALDLAFDYSNPTGGGYDTATGTYTLLSYADTVYDMTKVSLSHVETLSVNGPLSSSNGARTVVKVDAASLADVTTISNLSAGTEARLTTEASTLDLSGRTVTGVKIESSNATGTTFTVDSADAALHVFGGSGNDTLVVKGVTLTSAQRDQIFTGAVETVTDASGTYIKPGSSPGTPGTIAVSGLTDGNAVEGQAITATVADQDGVPASLTYSFKSGTTLLQSGTLASYTPSHADVGTAIRVEVAYTDGHGHAESLFQSAGTVQAPAVFTVPGATAGDDTLYGQSGTNRAELIDGLAGNDKLYGYGGSDHLIGGTGNDRLDGGTGADLMEGGADNDTYYVDDAGDTVTEAVRGGTDNIYTSVDYTLGADQEVEFLRANAGSTGLKLTGNAFANGLIGGAGVDVLAGGAGNDTYIVDNAGDQVIEAVGGGADTVYASVDYALSAGQEIEFLRANAGGTGLKLTGNEFANTLYGGGGIDTLAGGRGSDTYYVNNAGDHVVEAVGGGTDTVYASVSYTLEAGQETEFLVGNAGTTGLTLTGNERTNSLVSGAGNDVLIGGAGSDNYNVNNAGDRIVEAIGGGADSVFSSVDYTLAAGQEIEQIFANAGATGLSLTGNEFANRLVGAGGADHLYGGGGKDILDGRGGADILEGGSGDDFYYLDSSSDQVIEAVGGGLDNVYTSANFTLAAGQEVEFLRANAGTTGLTLTGNAFSNSIVGGGGIDTLIGGAGDDAYSVNDAGDQVIEQVGGGFDTVFTSVSYTLGVGQEIEVLRANAGTASLTLTGNEFNNTLYSGYGIDTLVGGGGNDTYNVNNTGDVVTEAVGGGTDNVYTSVNYTLGAGQEIEFLRANAGATGLTLTGNERDNGLIGGAGNDTLVGGAGNDVYTVDNAVDRVIEQVGGGSDTVYASVSYTLGAGQEIETLRAAGANGLMLTGNTFANSIIGGAGNDVIAGSGGADVLRGAGGADSFVFKALSDSGVGAGRTTIADFTASSDHIDLSAIQAVTSAPTDQAFNFIGTSAFTKHAGELHQITIGSTTVIEGDVDGNGTADFQIGLTGLLQLHAADFVL